MKPDHLGDYVACIYAYLHNFLVLSTRSNPESLTNVASQWPVGRLAVDVVHCCRRQSGKVAKRQDLGPEATPMARTRALQLEPMAWERVDLGVPKKAPTKVGALSHPQVNPR